MQWGKGNQTNNAVQNLHEPHIIKSLRIWMKRERESSLLCEQLCARCNRIGNIGALWREAYIGLYELLCQRYKFNDLRAYEHHEWLDYFVGCFAFMGNEKGRV